VNQMSGNYRFGPDVRVGGTMHPTQGPLKLNQKSIFQTFFGKGGRFSPKVDKSEQTAPQMGMRSTSKCLQWKRVNLCIQGNLAHKKQPPPEDPRVAYAWGHIVVLGGDDISYE